MKKWFLGLALVVGGVTFGVTSTLAVQTYIKESAPSPMAEPAPLQNFFSDSFFSEDFFNFDPFADMRKMREQMMSGFGVGINSVSVQPKEDANYLIYEVAGEGVSPESVNIKVADGFVNISGKVEEKSSTEKDGSTSSFLSSSSFNQSFAIPGHVNADEVKMEHVDDKILIKFPKQRNTI